jgi:hypothetical protein
MPRPKPPEELFPVSYRLTRTQIRKVQSMGGVAWLRKMISKAEAAKNGRDPVEHVRAIAKRNQDIGRSGFSTEVLALTYNLSVQRVRQIRKQQNA